MNMINYEDRATADVNMFLTYLALGTLCNLLYNIDTSEIYEPDSW